MKDQIAGIDIYGGRTPTQEMKALSEKLVDSIISYAEENRDGDIDPRELIAAGFQAAIFALKTETASQALGKAQAQIVANWLDAQAFIPKSQELGAFGRVLS